MKKPFSNEEINSLTNELTALEKKILSLDRSNWYENKLRNHYVHRLNYVCYDLEQKLEKNLKYYRLTKFSVIK